MAFAVLGCDRAAEIAPPAPVGAQPERLTEKRHGPVYGVVATAFGDPIPGVQVSCRGIELGQTNRFGEFSVGVPTGGEDAELLFRRKGFADTSLATRGAEPREVAVRLQTAEAPPPDAWHFSLCHVGGAALEDASVTVRSRSGRTVVVRSTSDGKVWIPRSEFPPDRCDVTVVETNERVCTFRDVHFVDGAILGVTGEAPGPASKVVFLPQDLPSGDFGVTVSFLDQDGQLDSSMRTAGRFETSVTKESDVAWVNVRTPTQWLSWSASAPPPSFGALARRGRRCSLNGLGRDAEVVLFVTYPGESPTLSAGIELDLDPEAGVRDGIATVDSSDAGLPSVTAPAEFSLSLRPASGEKDVRVVYDAGLLHAAPQGSGSETVECRVLRGTSRLRVRVVSESGTNRVTYRIVLARRGGPFVAAREAAPETEVEFSDLCAGCFVLWLEPLRTRRTRDDQRVLTVMRAYDIQSILIGAGSQQEARVRGP